MEGKIREDGAFLPPGLREFEEGIKEAEAGIKGCEERLEELRMTGRKDSTEAKRLQKEIVSLEAELLKLRMMDRVSKKQMTLW